MSVHSMAEGAANPLGHAMAACFVVSWADRRLPHGGPHYMTGQTIQGAVGFASYPIKCSQFAHAEVAPMSTRTTAHRDARFCIAFGHTCVG